MDVAIYARVSSDKQDVDLSISAQLRALTQFAEAQGHQVVRQFVDEVESGRSIRRAEFQEMISLARRKPPPFQVILVWKLSRFARDREDSILYKSFLKKQGVKVISINEPLDDSPTGRMMEGIIEVLDEFYSANLAQDVVRGMREATSRGFWVSAGTPYGYRRVKVLDGGKSRVKLEPDDGNSDVVRSIFRLALAGEGVKESSKGLNRQGIPSSKGKRWGKSQVDASMTPTLAAHGTAGDVMPIDAAERFVSSYSVAGAEARLEPFEGMPHGFGNEPGPELARLVQVVKEFIAEQPG